MKKDTRTLKEIGEKLKRLRIKNGYKSAETFAVDHDLSRLQYWRMEAGKTNMTITSLTAILKIHRITIADFFSKD